MRRVLKVFVSLFIFLMVIIVALIKRKDSINKEIIESINNSIISEIEETEERWWRTFDNHNELAYWVAVKNGDWSDLHLTSYFRSKYNEKDGIFGDMQFDKVEYRPYHDGKYPFEDFPYLVVTQGKKKTAYSYQLIDDMGDGYNDVEITNIYQLTDEDEKESLKKTFLHKCFY